MHHPVASAGVALLALILATGAAAQTSEGLSPTLSAIKNSHVVHLGYRESSPPFSFLDQANRPIRLKMLNSRTKSAASTCVF